MIQNLSLKIQMNLFELVGSKKDFKELLWIEIKA